MFLLLAGNTWDNFILVSVSCHFQLIRPLRQDVLHCLRSPEFAIQCLCWSWHVCCWSSYTEAIWIWFSRLLFPLLVFHRCICSKRMESIQSTEIALLQIISFGLCSVKSANIFNDVSVLYPTLYKLIWTILQNYVCNPKIFSNLF